MNPNPAFDARCRHGLFDVGRAIMRFGKHKKRAVAIVVRFFNIDVYRRTCANVQERIANEPPLVRFALEQIFRPCG